MKRQELGRSGEDFAARFLEGKGWRIIDRNVRTRRGEIDLIADDGGTIVFVEVKARSSDAAGLPLEAISLEKARRLRRLAQECYAKHPEWAGREYRVDCIGILTGEKIEVEHVEDALE